MRTKVNNQEILSSLSFLSIMNIADDVAISNWFIIETFLRHHTIVNITKYLASLINKSRRRQSFHLFLLSIATKHRVSLNSNLTTLKF